MAFSMRMLKKYGFLTSGDAARQGIGTMTNARWKEMFDFMVANRMLPANFDYRQAYDLQFIRQLHVMPAKP